MASASIINNIIKKRISFLLKNFFFPNNRIQEYKKAILVWIILSHF